jgi:DNA-binding MarR family transcriptional regulator
MPHKYNSKAATKKPIKFIAVPKIYDAAVPLRSRIIIGAILFRRRLNRGAAIRWLAEFTGFDRTTIRRHLKALEKANYVFRHRGEWLVNNPTDSPLELRYKWKKNAKAGDKWWDKIQTFHLKLPIPYARTFVPYCVLAGLKHLKSPQQTISGLGKMFGVPRGTMQRAIKYLVRKKHISTEPIINAVGLTTAYKIEILAADQKGGVVGGNNTAGVNGSGNSASAGTSWLATIEVYGQEVRSINQQFGAALAHQFYQLWWKDTASLWRFSRECGSDASNWTAERLTAWLKQSKQQADQQPTAPTIPTAPPANNTAVVNSGFEIDPESAQRLAEWVDTLN